MSLPRSHRTVLPRTVHHRARTAVALVAAGLLTAALGACSGGGDADDSSAAGSPADSAVLSEDQPEAVHNGVTAGSAALMAEAGRDVSAFPALGLEPAQLEVRDIIRTGSVSLVAADPTATRDRIVDLVTDLGGYVSDESARTRGSDGVDEISVILQVPTARFDDAVDRVSALGRVTSRTTKAEDVTSQVADVDSRVESARAALTRIRALLDRAPSLGTVIRLEGVLSNRQADLEALLAQQSALAGLTALGTLEVAVEGPREAAITPDREETRGFVEGLKAGWSGLSDTFVVASTAVGAVLPFALLIAVLGVPALLWWRRRASPVPAAAGPQ